MGIKRALSAAAALVTVTGTMLATGLAPAGAATSPADQGVTATTIQGGNPYVNFVALKSVGVNINEGSFPDAYNAIAAYMNAHGGFDGRKLVMNYAEMNPAVAADQTSSCSTLTEDDHIFVAFAPVFPACYQTTHDTLVEGGSLPGAVTATTAPDFSLAAPDAPFDALMLANFQKRGVFKGKKVAIYYGADSDKPEVTAVQADLKKLGIPLALTAEDSAVATDVVASDQETASIAERFKSAGVGVVIGVGGSGSTTWVRAQLDNQSTYKPLYIPTSESSLLSYVETAKGGNPVPGQRADRYPDALQLRAVEGPGNPKVRGRRQEGLPVGRDRCTAESHQSRRGVGAGHRRIGYSGLPVPHPLPEDRRRGREELDGGQLHQGGLRIEERVDPGNWWRPGLIRQKPALRHRSHHGGDLQPDVEDPGARFSHGEVTRARFTAPNYVDGGDVAGWIPERRWGLD